MARSGQVKEWGRGIPGILRPDGLCDGPKKSWGLSVKHKEKGSRGSQSQVEAKSRRTLEAMINKSSELIIREPEAFGRVEQRSNIILMYVLKRSLWLLCRKYCHPWVSSGDWLKDP